jgi:hypothetical protein
MMVIDIGDDAKLLVNFKGGWCWVKRHSGNDVIQFTRWKRNILITVVHLFFAPMGSSKKIRLPEHVKITTEYAIMSPIGIHAKHFRQNTLNASIITCHTPRQVVAIVTMQASVLFVSFPCIERDHTCTH